ncbi:ABC transporter ATP-binding protein [Streptoalloteichus hindustanus]|uniref:ABC transporter ATP-binding protein n=1 Tax=Streptoalloteichus hindustanus TaxID=2017 RepID=UPI00389B0A8F
MDLDRDATDIETREPDGEARGQRSPTVERTPHLTSAPDRPGTVDVPGRVSVAFQDARLLPWRRVAHNVRLGLRRPDADEVVERALDEVGLTGHRDAWPLTLSGGEAQRVSLARALVREPDLLLLDEPFGALDALTRLSMHRLVLQLWQHHAPAVLLVTHDVDEALTLADRVLVLADGRIAAEHAIPLSRPRRRADLTELRALVLDHLGVSGRVVA